jgi:hypothetical protein
MQKHEGRTVDRGTAYLKKLNSIAIGLKPSGVGGLTIAFASLLGVPSLGMHLAMSAALAISGALVLILIIALSNPFRGDFRVSTQPFNQVLADIQASTTQP